MKLKTTRCFFSFLALVVLFAQPALAKGDGNRANKRFGFTVGLFSDPYPNMVGMSLRYNLTDFFQLNAGYGMLSITSVDPSTGGATTISTTALGGGARLFVPGWNLSPFVGFNYVSWSATGTFNLGGSSVNAGSGLPAVMYVTTGLDWQTSAGFNIGLGAHLILGPTQLKQSLPFTPHLYLGWYF